MPRSSILQILASSLVLAAAAIAQAPSIQRVTPPQAHWSAGPVTVTIRGQNFSTSPAANPQVRIGALQATNVQVVDTQTIVCTAPADTVPGPKDVFVTMNGQTGTSTGGFARTPAVSFTSGPQIGQTATFRAQVRVGDFVGGYFSWGALNPRSVPGVHGTLFLLQPTQWFVMIAWPLSEFSVSAMIPNDAGLLGWNPAFQVLTGGPAIDPVLSNVVQLGL
ncbi:MAG: hypothetical protein RIT25_309 [Planctomycetota bacterium]